MRACSGLLLVFVASAALAADGKGMTWSKLSHDSRLGIDQVACNQGAPGGCDPYLGDTSCNSSRPVLCIKVDDSQRPPYTPDGGEFYDGWSGGHIATTLPVVGKLLGSATAGDKICAAAFGSGWRMAEFHDNRTGGWGFRAYGDVRSDQHYWVRIADQPANCWDP